MTVIFQNIIDKIDSLINDLELRYDDLSEEEMKTAYVSISAQSAKRIVDYLNQYAGFLKNIEPGLPSDMEEPKND
tara:strand:+ start:506 stop:730 length:225 start_codon:yes stop_codon:yes gene_type:complete